MQVYYKYTNLFPIEYFNNPTIKISPTAYLNDPFEYNASENIIHSIRKHLQDIGLDDDYILRGVSSYIKSINAMLSLNGIVSFSETPRNSLMWAHYAGQHYGMCIGYDKNILKHIEDDNADISFYITLNTPQKINYDNLRFESDHYFDRSNQDLDRQATIKHLLKKSDEWIYEKEHRCIIPYYKTDTIILTSDAAIVDQKYTPLKELSAVKVGTPFEVIIKMAIENGMLSATETKNKYSVNKEGLDPVLFARLQTSKNAVHLVNINPDSIHSIYFGCNVSEETIRPYYEHLKDRYPMYKFEISKKRFELIPVLVTDDMFNK